VGLKDGLLLDMALEMKSGQGLPRHEQAWKSAMRLGQTCNSLPAMQEG
jgi:hypothetical protein